MSDDRAKHHVWCNYFSKPSEGCRMCADLFKRFPPSANMMEEHFPDAVPILPVTTTEN